MIVEYTFRPSKNDSSYCYVYAKDWIIRTLNLKGKQLILIVSCFYDSDPLEKKYLAEFLDELDLLSIPHFLLKPSSCELQQFTKTLQFYEFINL